jgi:hypothetical protein
MELSLEVLFLFLLVFSSLFVIKQVFNIVLNVLSSQPKILEYTRTETIMNYLTLTYILTFIIQSF